jgi:hypothetical protein
MDVLLPLLTGYDRLLLVVHPDPVRLAQVGDELVSRTGWPLLSVGATLVAALGVMAPDRRPMQVRTILVAAIRSSAIGPEPTIILGDLSPLFDPSLAVNALDVLRRCTNEARLVVLWPGSLTDSTLSFAEPRHAHYRSWPRPATGAISVR